MNTPKQNTPGPWRVSAAPLTPDVSTRWIEVYSVDPEDDVASVTGGNLKAAQANARLIAAAPDLLAALEALTEVARKHLPQGADHDGLNNCGIIANANKAIAEAKEGK